MNKNELILANDDSLNMINKALSAITKHHKKVSNLKTPKAYIYKKDTGMGKKLDYVKYPYMRDVANKHFPGWSWTIINTEFAGTEAFVVHGRLKWFDNGVWREGDMTAAHRIQKKRGTTQYVDLGNDIKSANTDCIKKAMNHYMSIADDIYKAQVKSEEEIVAEIEKNKLSSEELSEILKLAQNAGKLNEIKNKIETHEISKTNYEGACAKLTRLTQTDL